MYPGGSNPQLFSMMGMDPSQQGQIFPPNDNANRPAASPGAAGPAAQVKQFKQLATYMMNYELSYSELSAKWNKDSIVNNKTIIINKFFFFLKKSAQKVHMHAHINKQRTH